MDRSTIFLFAIIVIMGVGISFGGQLGAKAWEGQMVDLHDRVGRGEITIEDIARRMEEQQSASGRGRAQESPQRSPDAASSQPAVLAAAMGGGIVALFGLVGAALLLARDDEDEDPQEETAD